MESHLSDLELLQASADANDESEFRILVNNQYVKYLTIDVGLYDVVDMCCGPSLISLLPPFPPRDWNTARVSRDATTGKPHFVNVSKATLSGIARTWHPTQVDYLEPHMGGSLRSNVYEATCSRFSSKVFVKFARFLWEVPQLEAETVAHKWIKGHQIGPVFLGHLAEDGRVIGFIMARIDDSRHATVEDFALCEQALLRLHGLGIKHGDINKHNFFIRDAKGLKATLIDFDCALRPTSADDLERELHTLEDELRDTSGRGGQIIGSGPDWDSWPTLRRS